MTTESAPDVGVEADRPHEVEVLVVDTDTQYLLNLLDRVDRDTDELTVHTSREVQETVERLEEDDVDCLVCTYDPADMAGMELLDYLREHPTEVPVVLLPARETTIIDSRNLVADVDSVFPRDEAVEQDVFGPHLVNVVEQQRAAAGAERRSQVTEVMGRVARDIAGADEPDEVDEAVVERLADTNAFEAGWVAEVDEDGPTPPTAATEDIEAVPGIAEDGPEPPLSSAAERAVDYEQSQIVNTDEYSYAVVPVDPERGKERALAVSSDSKFAFREPEVDLLAELGGTLSRTLDTIATRDALEDRVDDLELVDDLVEDLGVPVAVYDQSGRIERTNAAFAELFGRDREAVSDTAVWEYLDPRSPVSFEEHWSETDAKEPTTESTVIDGVERDLVTTRVRAERVPYNVTMVVETEEEAPMDQAFAETLAYEFRHWFGLAQEAVEEAREEGDPDQLQLVDELVGRMQDAIETEVETATSPPDTAPEMDPQPLGEVAGLAWNHVLGEAGRHEVKGGRAVLANRGLLLRLFEHLFRTLLQYAEAATSVDVGLTNDGFYVKDDGAGVPHAERAYVDEGTRSSDAAHGAGILVAERAAERMGWTLTTTESEGGGTRFVVSGARFAKRED